MMSSEEETGDCFGLYGDKLLNKKTKRTRQRVDAGEPRNSYSSIPNFSSRPSFLGGGLYNTIFSQSQQRFGLFAPGFAPAKMLNELIGRQVKQASDATNSPTNDTAMMTAVDNSGVTDTTAKYDSVIRRDENLSPQPPQSATDLTAHHMLRDILQGRKHDLLALEHELRAAAGASDNNNTITADNNNETKEDAEAAAAMRECLAEAGVVKGELIEETLETASLPSPKPAASPARPEDAKRARVEHIVSGMQRASPAPAAAVNGCKKRKLYQPQQHADTLTATLDGCSEDDDEPEPLRQKRVEKDALKHQLRTMQEQLAEMQQKYVQLCTRMEQESENQDIDEVSSDIDQDISEEKTPPASPTRSEVVVNGPTPGPGPQMLSQAVSKMMSAARGPPPPPHAMHPGPFNGMAGLVHGNEGTPLSNAAAMYLGVSHKLFLEQEARLAKEAAERHHHQQVQEHHQQQQHAAAAAAQQQAAQAAAAAQQNRVQQHESASQQMQHSHPHRQQSPPQPKELAERLQMLRQPTITGSELEGLADVLKSEITASLSNLIDSIVTRFVHQRRFMDRKSPRTKVVSQGPPLPNQQQQQPPPPGSVQQMTQQGPPVSQQGGPPPMNVSGPPQPPQPRMNGVSSFSQQMSSMQLQHMAAAAAAAAAQQNGGGEHRSSASGSMFPSSKAPPPGMAALYGLGPQHNPFCMQQQQERENPEQNEALSLVVTPKKKRHKVTDTRITPRTVSRILAQDGNGGGPLNIGSPPGSDGPRPGDCPSPRPYHPPPPPMLPVSLPTSVAIPNPGLHESQVFSPYSPFFTGPGGHHHLVAGPAGASPPGLGKLERDSPPLPHPPTLLHPALLAAAQHGASPDYGHMMAPKCESGDRNSDCNSADIGYDGIQPTSSTLTPMHLRKAKLMFFWVRYPSSAVLKMYFPDIKFNKNNTAQLVKWFSNFREFYYIQMEKYARQAVSEGVKNAEDLHVGADSELYRVLNLHYNRNNHIEVWGPQVPSNFRFVVEQTLREFFKAIQGGKDAEQSWKKSIYKIISRLDDPVPEYFKSPNFLEQLE